MPHQTLEELSNFKHLSRCYSKVTSQKSGKSSEITRLFERSLNNLIELGVDP